MVMARRKKAVGPKWEAALHQSLPSQRAPTESGSQEKPRCYDRLAPYPDALTISDLWPQSVWSGESASKGMARPERFDPERYSRKTKRQDYCRQHAQPISPVTREIWFAGGKKLVPN